MLIEFNEMEYLFEEKLALCAFIFEFPYSLLDGLLGVLLVSYPDCLIGIRNWVQILYEDILDT